MFYKIGELEVSEGQRTELASFTGTASVLILCVSVGHLVYSYVSVQQLASTQLGSFEVGGTYKKSH